MKKQIKRLRLFLVTAALAMCMIPVWCGHAQAAQINSQKVTLYALDTWAQSYISVPSRYKQSYTLKVSGASNVTYSVVQGNSVKVTAKGKITPASTIWYWNGNFASTVPSGQEGEVKKEAYNYGSSKIKVQAGDETFYVKVKVVDYAKTYAEKKMNKYISANINSDMSVKEKLEEICKFVAGYNYSTEASGAVSMIVTGGGDCWASTDAIIAMCKKAGITAWARNGNRDPGSGSGHRNAMVKGDGTYYEAEAGYTGNAPRIYSIKERTSLYSYKSADGGIEVYQYDGQSGSKKSLSVPSEIDGNKVVGIGEKFLQMNTSVAEVKLPSTVTYIGDSAFNSCTSLRKINIPANVKSIGNFVFTNCASLTKFTCDKGNNNYTIVSGVLYNKSKTKILYVPAAKSVKIPSGVKKISDYAFYYNHNLKSVTIPSSVTSIGEGAFGDCTALSNVSIKGNRLKKIGDYAFRNCNNLVLRCTKNSTAHKYAKENSISYKLN